MTRIKFILLTAALLPLSAVAKPLRQAVKDVIRPLPDGCVRLTNFFENDILNSEQHWNKGVLPYKGLVEFFRKGRPKFAVGEMWGKAVRSGAMYYRYTRDPMLRRILQATMKDLLTTVRSNGSISCTPVDEQPGSSGEVAVKPVKPTLPGTRMEFLVPTTDGYVRISDYASVNGWDGKRICTWMPVRK